MLSKVDHAKYIHDASIKGKFETQSTSTPVIKS